MTHDGVALREPLGAVLSRLRLVLQRQADALSADDFDDLDRLDAEREQLMAVLAQYSAVDTHPDDRGLLEQVGALDQRLLSVARESLERTEQELREIHRGRGALSAYQRRGQTVVRALARLDREG